MALLEVRGLVKQFGGLRAVDGCTFDVEEGGITALIGPNGAGKTTVFNVVSGLLKPDAGEVRFRGERITGLPPHAITRRRISRTFQITRELAEMSVLENVVVHAPVRRFFDLFRGDVLGEERERAMGLLEFVGLAFLADQPARNLSYGQRKLLELAGALMAEPHLIMLDEPAGGVNPALLGQILDRIEQLNRDGVTFVIVEHNMDVVMSMSDTVVVMAHGDVLVQDSPDAVQVNEAVLDAYLGAA